MSGLRNWVVWSLYDGSGYAVKDWADAGYKCYCFNYDGANHGDYEGVKSFILTLNMSTYGLTAISW